jgi:hypothetical protein
LVNSECSICIGTLIEFLLLLDQTGQKIPVIIILEIGNKEIFDYYIGQCQFSDNIKVYYVENSNNEYVVGRLEDHNGEIFYLYEDKIINSLNFELLSH